jgi:hypothetical protein
MTLRAVGEGTVIRVIVRNDAGQETVVGTMTRPLRISRLAELLGTYEQSPEACGPLVTLGPDFDDSLLTSTAFGLTEWQHQLLLAAWATDSDGAHLYPKLKDLSPST